TGDRRGDYRPERRRVLLSRVAARRAIAWLDAVQYGGVNHVDEAGGAQEKPRRWLAVVALLAAAGVEVAANSAPLPASWKPYRWTAWPVLALLLTVVVLVAVAARRGDHRRQRCSPTAAVRQSDAWAGGV